MAVPPPHADEIEGKAALRRRLRAARRDFVAGLDAGTLEAALAAIGARLAPLLERDGPFSGYLAGGGEPDVMPVLRAAHAAGSIVALPCITRTEMTFGAWHPDAALIPGFSGIPQPDGFEPVEPAVLLTPLVAFDRAGNRLGQGGGYYDRWFAAHPGAMRIGVAWSVQEVPALAVERWDMPLHAIVTEKEWIAPS